MGHQRKRPAGELALADCPSQAASFNWFVYTSQLLDMGCMISKPQSQIGVVDLRGSRVAEAVSVEIFMPTLSNTG